MKPDLSFGEPLRRRIAAHLEGFERRTVPLDGRRAAAVAVTLVADGDGRACFVLTLREALKRHARQFALPGGRIDPGETAEGAALRELAEEVGLAVSPSDVLGRLDDFPTRSGFVITPVVVWAGGAAELVPDPREVAAVFRVPLQELESPLVPILTRIPQSQRPVLSLPLGGTQVFSPTAAIVYQLREAALHGRPTRVAHYEQPVWAWR